MGIFDRFSEKPAAPVAEPVLVDAHPEFRQAFGSVTASIMIADAEHNIIYVNPSAHEMMRLAEEDIRKDLPHFSLDGMLGASIDIFHRNPAHQRSILDQLQSTHRAEATIGPRTFEIVATPMFDDAHQRTGTVVEWQDMTEMLAIKHEREERRIAEQAKAFEMSRLASALAATTANLVIADENNDIVFVNAALQELLKRKEDKIRKELPQFSADNLVGKNIDVFHEQPAHQQALLKALASTFTSDIVIGGVNFRLIANPVFDSNGQRIGTVVEWLDLTAEAAVNNEIGQIVAGATRGDLSRRIQTDDKEGFLRTLSLSINELLDSYDGVVDEVNTVMKGLAQGELEHRVSVDNKAGLFLSMASGLNALVDTFQAFTAEIDGVLSAIAEGDLSIRITNNYRGEFELIKANANEAVARLNQTVIEIRDTAAIVASGSQEIATGNTNLSQRTEEQAASLEETSSAMEEMTSTIQQNASNSTQADSLAQSARDAAENGGRVVNQAVVAMDAISDSSKRISEIISVIDEIAFQTNLLALNASVEAARAGEQGRGFAVVADEVRNLAGRSATAAKEIKELIEDSTRKVQEGSGLVNQSGETLEEIVTAVKKVSDIVAEISTASDEQASGIEEVNKAVIQMDELTQQNAALVEEAAAASESLGEQATALDRLMASFNTGNDTRPAKTRPEPRQVETHEKTAPTSALRPSIGDDGDEWSEF